MFRNCLILFAIWLSSSMLLSCTSPIITEAIDPTAPDPVMQIHVALRQIDTAAREYCSLFDNYSFTVDDLAAADLLYLDTDLRENWQFYIARLSIGMFVGAFSKPGHPEGSGWNAMLEGSTGVIYGYGGIELDNKTLLAAIIAVDDAARRYAIDNERPTRSLTVLKRTGYLSLRPEIEATWDFQFFIYKDDYYNLFALPTSWASRSKHYCGLGGKWITRPMFCNAGVINLPESFLNMQSILHINQAVQDYEEHYHESPTSVEELIEEEFLNELDIQGGYWSYVLIGSNPVSMIEAISTFRLSQSAGKVVTYEPFEAEFNGWGIE